MFGWKELGPTWPSEQTYQVLEILKQNRIRCRMPADDMFFYCPFRLPHTDRRWAIQVRRRDVKRAMALLAREGLAQEPGSADPIDAPDPPDTVRSGSRRPASASLAAHPAVAP